MAINLKKVVLKIIILLLTTISVESSNSSNEIFLVSLEKTRVKCITNSSNALSWNVPTTSVGDKFLKQVSEFVPQSSGQHFCDLNKSKFCRQLWQKDSWFLDNSITGVVREPIFDQRWETLKTYSTQVEEILALIIRKTSYVVPFSVRCQRGAKLILTDGLTRYSIGIPNFWNQFATISRCVNSTVDCPKFSYISVFNQNFSPNTNENIWKHYKLIVKSRNLSLIYLDDNGGEHSILEFTNLDFFTKFDFFTQTLVHVSTDGFEGLWKIHHDKYLRTSSEGSWTLGPDFEVFNKTFCLSILVSICKHCTLQLTLKDSNYSTQIFKNSQNLRRWQEVRFVTNNISETTVQLQVTTIVDGDTDGIFWAISNPRQCQKDELRVLTLKNFQYQDHCNALCQLFSFNKQPIKLAFRNLEEKPQSIDTFGRASLSCKQVYGKENCSQIKICEENDGNMITCTKIEGFPSCLLDESTEVVSIVLYTSLILLTLLLVIVAIMYIVKVRKQGEHLDVNETSNSNLIVRLVRSPPRIRAARMVKEKELLSECITIENFENYVHKAVMENQFRRQFELMSKTQPLYTELVDPEVSNVVLDEVNENNYVEISRATYIDSYKCSRAFIMTQPGLEVAPMAFWKIIWQENVRNVVKLDEETENFWPTTEEEINIDDIKVRLVTSRNFTNYEWKLFKATFRKKEREIALLTFTEWQNNASLCSQKLAPFLQKLLKITLDPKSPILVQSSTKANRNGAVILGDSCLRMAAQENSIDALNIWGKMRKQKAIITEDLEAYKLAHFAVLECLINYQGEISCFELINEIRHVKTNDFVKLQANCIKSFAPPPNDTRIYENIEQNSNGFIRAFPVDGYRFPNRFLVTQYPTPALLSEFWQFVTENDVSAIVSLNEIGSDATLKELWHNEKVTQLDQVEVTSEFKLTTLALATTKQNKRVQIIWKKHWAASQLLPKNVHGFLTFWEKSSVITRTSGQVLVVCRDGVTACGLYIALSFLIEKMKLEQTCDVAKAVEVVRCGCPHFLTEKDQLLFLYEAVSNYLKRFGNYSNFL